MNYFFSGEIRSLGADLRTSLIDNDFRDSVGMFPALSRIQNWDHLILLITSRDTAEVELDKLLHALLKAYSLTGNQQLASALILAFLPRLISIHRRSHRWESSSEDLWQNTILAFMLTIRKPKFLSASGVARKMYWATFGELRDICTRMWKQSRSYKVPRKEVQISQVADYDAGQAMIDYQDECQVKLQKLDKCDVAPMDQRLIVLTRLEGKSLREAGTMLGISYGTAKYRRNLAERRVAQEQSRKFFLSTAGRRKDQVSLLQSA
jgi:DNA-directed RNA polymerase specialized sigma24 family protein